MKRLAALAAFAFTVGCTCDKPEVVDAGVPDAGPLALSEKEPNDGPDKALAIAARALVQANLGADPKSVDEDWYLLQTALPRTASLKVTAPTGADVAIEVMDEARTTLLVVNAAGPGDGETLPNLDVSGRAYFRVLGLKKGTGGAYSVAVELTDRQPGFELEPNNRQVDATQVALGAAISGYLSHPQDEDWYRFELPGAAEVPVVAQVDAGAPAGVVDAGDDEGPGQGITTGGPVRDADAGAVLPVADAEKVPLRIDISPIDGVRPEVTVLTIAEAVLFTAKAGQDGAGLSLRNVGIRKQDKVIFLVVKSAAAGTGKDAKKGHNAGSYYTLTVSPEEAGASAELEPNDDIEHATPLQSDSWKEGFLSPQGDTDYFRLTVAQPSIVDVSVTGVDKVDLQLLLVKPGAEGKGEEVLARANEGAVKEPEALHSLTCANVCVLKVEVVQRKVDGKWVRDQENGEVAYRISTAVTVDDGTREKEPNDKAEHGSPISLSASVRGTVYPKKDVDLFKLDLTQKQVKTPLKATLTGILKVDVALYLHRLDEEGKLELVQTSDRGKGDKPEVVRFSAEPGVYVFEVRDTRNREANIQDQYQLTVEESDD